MFIKETIRNILRILMVCLQSKYSFTHPHMQIMEPETLQSHPAPQTITPGGPGPEDEPQPAKNEPEALRLLSKMETLHGNELDQSLPLLLGVFGSGQSELLAQKPALLNKIMDHFVALSRSFQRHPSQQLQYKVFFTLSLLAQYLRRTPKVLLLMSGKFLQYILSIECGDLPQGQRSKMAAILAMFYGNIARQTRVLGDHGLAKQFKGVLLQNYAMLEGIGQRIVNQAILRLQTKKSVVFSMAELERYGIKAKILESLPGRQREMVEQHMKQLFPLVVSKKK